MNNIILQQLQRIESLLLNNKTVMNFEETAQYTGLSKSYLYKLTSNGGIPCYKPNGKHIYFNKQEVDNWLLQNRKATSEETENQVVDYITLSEKEDK